MHCPSTKKCDNVICVCMFKIAITITNWVIINAFVF